MSSSDLDLAKESDQEQLLSALNLNNASLEALIQAELDATQSLLQGEFDETQAKQDLAKAVLDAVNGKLNSLGQKLITTSVPVVLASNQTPHPTFSELNYYARQGLTFRVHFPLQAVAGTSEVPILLLRNPIGSGKNIEVFRQECGIISNNATGIHRTYLSPTVTADGTPLGVHSDRRPGLVASVSQVFSYPTVSSNGDGFHTKILSTTLNWCVDPFTTRIILTPGRSMLMTQQNSTNNTQVMAAVQWVEL